MATVARKRRKWPIAIAIVAVIGLGLLFLANRSHPNPYRFISELGPRFQAEQDQDIRYTYVEPPARARIFIFSPDKALHVIRSIDSRLKVATDLYPTTVGAPKPGYAHWFTDSHGSYVSIRVCNVPKQMVVLDHVHYMTFGECLVEVHQPMPHSGILDYLKKLFHL